MINRVVQKLKFPNNSDAGNIEKFAQRLVKNGVDEDETLFVYGDKL